MIPERLAVRRPTESEVREFCKLCSSIEEGVLEKGDVTGLLSEWNARANREFSPEEFTRYSGAIDTEEFARTALAPVPRFVPDLTYAELRAVLECVMKVTIKGEAHSFFLGWLAVQFPQAAIRELIYWPDRWFGVPAALHFEFTPDQLLRAAMERDGRLLSDAPEVSVPYPVPPKQRVLVTPPSDETRG